MFFWTRKITPTAYLGLAFFLAVTLLPDLALAQTTPSVGGSGPINWSTFTSLFTSFQNAIMTVVAVICVICFIGTIISAIASGINGITIALFSVMIGCVLVLAGPDIITWIKTIV